MSSRRINRRAFLVGGVGTAAAAALGWYNRDRGRRFITRTFNDFMAPELKFAQFDALDEAYDVCIIGSGPAGSVLGLDLVGQGVRTLILESGILPQQSTDVARVRDLEVYQSGGELDYPVASTRVRGLGGTSAIWTGRCARLHPLDFEVNAYTPAACPWPITYADLEPYYQRAEETLHVQGSTLSQYHAPRQGALPLASATDYAPLATLMQQVDITIDESPTSTSVWGESGPLRVSRDLLPEFSQSQHATLVSGATVTRLIADADGRIEGAEVHSLNDEMKVIKAKRFVVACGALESARLLRLSTSDAFPAGIGNEHDLVGRHFMEHPSLILRGTIPEQDTLPPIHLVGRSHQFYDQFKNEGLGSVILIFYWGPNKPRELRIGATLEMSPSPENRVSLAEDERDLFGNPAARLSLAFSEQDEQTFAKAKDLIREIYAGLGAEEVEEENDLHWSHHHMGTCRMGDNPETSVVDRNLRVHASPNLYVAGSATFVTGGASHPTLAITALSHRLAEHLTAELGGSVTRPDVQVARPSHM